MTAQLPAVYVVASALSGHRLRNVSSVHSTHAQCDYVDGRPQHRITASVDSSTHSAESTVRVTSPTGNRLPLRQNFVVTRTRLTVITVKRSSVVAKPVRRDVRAKSSVESRSKHNQPWVSEFVERAYRSELAQWHVLRVVGWKNELKHKRGPRTVLAHTYFRFPESHLHSNSYMFYETLRPTKF